MNGGRSRTVLLLELTRLAKNLKFADMRMNELPGAIRKFLAAEDGPTAVEYAVMLAMIVMVCIVAIQSIGTNAKATFQKVGTQLEFGILEFLPIDRGEKASASEGIV